jgi:hypothetical protein
LSGLAAEIEYDDAVGRFAFCRRGAHRRRRVQRNFEVGLYFGVVRREHAVAGVGRFAVDGLAAVALLDGSLPVL